MGASTFTAWRRCLRVVESVSESIPYGSQKLEGAGDFRTPFIDFSQDDNPADLCGNKVEVTRVDDTWTFTGATAGLTESIYGGPFPGDNVTNFEMPFTMTIEILS